MQQKCYRNECVRQSLEGSSFCYDHGGRVQSVPPSTAITPVAATEHEFLRKPPAVEQTIQRIAAAKEEST